MRVVFRAPFCGAFLLPRIASSFCVFREKRGDAPRAHPHRSLADESTKRRGLRTRGEQLDRLETHNGWMHGSGFRRAISGSIRKVAAVRAAGIGAHGVGVKVVDTGAGSHRSVCGRGRVFREGICWIGRRRNKCPSGLDRCCQSAARVESISERGFRGRIRVNPGGIPQNSGGKLCAGALEVG